MNIIVNGKKVTLAKTDFVTKGGEGSIYRKGNTAYKIYEDLGKMIPVAKIQELASLNNPSIVNPKDIIYNDKKHEIGFTMEWLGENTYSLCKLFTNTFRNNNGIENDHVIALVEKMKKVTEYIHQNKFLIVDGNELNYMVDNNFETPYFIDINAWQTPSYQANAIMPSIRDWKNNEFTVLTDWFSFAIVTFQLFVGIHPFRGKHPGYRKNDFPNRIIDCVSVFNGAVSIPPATRDFNLIPSAYKDWYFALFENGERKIPPMLPGEAGKILVKVQLIQSTDNFEITELQEFIGDVLYHNSKYRLTKTKERVYIGKTDYKISLESEVVFTEIESYPIFVKIIDNKIKFYRLNLPEPILDLNCTDMMITNNTLFLKNNENLMEITFKVFNNNVHPIVKKVWHIEPNSSQMFSNVIVQSVLGRKYLAIPLPHYDKSSFIIKEVPEIDNFQIMDAKYENRVCVLTGHQGGVYSRFVFIFDEKHKKYSFRSQINVDYAPINFVCLDNGVCVLITDDDAIEIFLNRTDKDSVKRIEDPIINSTMTLCHNGNSVQFFRDNKLYQIKMR
jgi:hypothetical protein